MLIRFMFSLNSPKNEFTLLNMWVFFFNRPYWKWYPGFQLEVKSSIYTRQERSEDSLSMWQVSFRSMNEVCTINHISGNPIFNFCPFWRIKAFYSVSLKTNVVLTRLATYIFSLILECCWTNNFALIFRKSLNKYVE